ncbi:MAG TPA: trehalase family glycosidase [Acidothermaceae bacterium]
MTAPPGPAFSVRDIPFSYYGSWFDISPVLAERVYSDDLHLVSHQTAMHPILSLIPWHGGARIETTVLASPHRLVWQHDTGSIELAYEQADTVRIRGKNLGLRIRAAIEALTPFAGTYFYRDPVDKSFIFTVYGTGRRYRITPLAGAVIDVVGEQSVGSHERALTLTADDAAWEVAIEEFESSRAAYNARSSFDDIVWAAQENFANFVDAVAPWRTENTPAAALAAYVLWSATVLPAGFIGRPAVLMSKHWMDKVWSWDHCFNALALAGGLPDLAWDQFQLVFDHQDDVGGLPDSIAHSEILYNFVKPPIHGWALQKLRQCQHVEPVELLRAYRGLAKWTNYWLVMRRAPGHTLCHYHHGNDSGWDNATTFDAERVVETSDLASFLVLQTQQLADLATGLGLLTDADHWADVSDKMCAAMLAQLWVAGKFVARGAESGLTYSSSSLLDLMAIVLGPKLPDDVRAALARSIESHLTVHGLATELVSSPEYRSDGYWRGPIWAPSTILVEDGLRRSGFVALADEISGRFRALCERSGFAENFDAETGIGLRDHAYTWTASSYLILAAAHAQRHPTTAVPAHAASQ